MELVKSAIPAAEVMGFQAGAGGDEIGTPFGELMKRGVASARCQRKSQKAVQQHTQRVEP